MERDASPAPGPVWRLSVAGDLDGLPAGVTKALPPGPAGTLLLDLAALTAPFDARDIDRLARVALAARRRGWAVRVAEAPPALVELIELTGLGPALLGAPA